VNYSTFTEEREVKRVGGKQESSITEGVSIPRISFSSIERRQVL